MRGADRGVPGAARHAHMDATVCALPRLTATRPRPLRGASTRRAVASAWQAGRPAWATTIGISRRIADGRSPTRP
jgi:hypothetical protein